jgi:hypothetical protein
MLHTEITAQILVISRPIPPSHVGILFRQILVVILGRVSSVRKNRLWVSILLFRRIWIQVVVLEQPLCSLL